MQTFRHMMTKTALIILTFLLLTTAYAQKDTVRLGVEVFFPEYNQADISEFNDLLKAHNFPTKDYWPFSFRVGAGLYYKKFRITILTGGLKNRPEENGDTTVLYGTNFSSVHIGYDLLTIKKFRLYPFTGFKTTRLTYDFTISQTYNSIQNYLQASSFNKTLDYRRNNLVFGLGIEYGDDFLVGLQSGLYMPLGEGRWRFADNTLNDNIPTIDFKYFIGFYWALKM